MTKSNPLKYLRLIFVISFVVIQLIDFSIYRVTFDMLYLLGIISLSGAFVLYRVHHRLLLQLSTLYFVIISLFMFFGFSTPRIEKLSIWSFIFLCNWVLFEILSSRLSLKKRKTNIIYPILDDFSTFIELVKNKQVVIPIPNFILLSPIWPVIKQIKNSKTIRISVSKAIILVFFYFGIFRNLINQFHFFSSYFIEDKLKSYFKQTGNVQISLFFVIIFVGFSVIFRKKNKFVKHLTLLFLVLIAQVYSFNFTTRDLVDNPVILKIMPQSNKIWAQVHIYGHNFGAAQYNDAQVYVEGVEHRVLKWENDEIVFIADPFLSKSGEVWVRNVDAKESNRVLFEYIK